MNRILLVDDEQNVLNALCRELKEDYLTEAFSNPVDALARSKEIAFDLVISDYQMPAMNGVEFLKQFGVIQPDASRLILSGQADIDALISAINDTHIYRFIAKPWDKAELQSCISQALDFRNIVLETRRQANLYRLSRTPLVMDQTSKVYRVILVDDDKVSLSVMSRGLREDTNYEGVQGAMRREISHGKSGDAPDLKLVVDAFTSAAAALAYAKNIHCDLAIAAQTLPDMDGTQFLSELIRIRPDAARILISSNPDKALLSKAINDSQVHSFVCLYWNTAESGADITRQSLEIQQLKTAVIQALASRNLSLENQRLAGLNK